MPNIRITQLPVATTANAGDVLPIVQNGVTKKIDAAALGGGGGIQIPIPQFKIGRFENGVQKLDVFYLPTANAEWLNHSPEIWLYRLAKRGTKKKNDVQYKRPAKYSHPTNTDPAHTSTNTQNDDGEIYKGQTKWDIRTEWTVPQNWKAHKKLPGFFFNALQFFSNDNGANSAVALTFPQPTSATLNTDTLNPTGTRNKDTIQNAVFQFRFVIRDPNNAQRVIIGEASETIRAFAAQNQNQMTGIGLNIRMRQK